MNKIVVNKVDTYQGHKDAVYSLETGSDKSVFYSAAGDGMVVKWNLNNPNNGELIARLTNSVYSIHYLRDTNFLVIGHNYDGIHFIDLNDKTEKASLNFVEGAIFDIKSFEEKLYVGDSSGQLYVISLKPLKVINRIRVAEKSVRSIAINEKSREVAVGTSDNHIKVYDLDDLSLKYRLDNHNNSVFTLKYSPDSKLLLSAGRDAHLMIWDVKAGYLLLDDIIAHMFAINNIAFSPNNKHFVTCSMDKSIKVWDAERFKLLKVIDKARHAGHGTSVNKVLWTSYNDLLVSASDDRTISVWNIEF